MIWDGFVFDPEDEGGVIVWNMGTLVTDLWHDILGGSILQIGRTERKIWGFHGRDYEECRLLGCSALWLL
jgi:hypothetical protein